MWIHGMKEDPDVADLSNLVNLHLRVEDVLAEHTSKTVILYFWAPWLGSCVAMNPEVEAFAALHPDITFIRVNTDHYLGVSKEFGVDTIPALVLVTPDGTNQKPITCRHSPEWLEEWLEKKRRI